MTGTFLFEKFPYLTSLMLDVGKGKLSGISGFSVLGAQIWTENQELSQDCGLCLCKLSRL